MLMLSSFANDDDDDNDDGDPHDDDACDDDACIDDHDEDDDGEYSFKCTLCPGPPNAFYAEQLCKWWRWW